MAAINAISGLITGIPGTNKPVAGPLDRGGFGPDYLVQLNQETFGDALGAGVVAAVGGIATGVLSQQADAATARQPIFTAKQARQIQEHVFAAAAAINRGDFDAARADAQELLRRDHNDPVGYHLLGRIAAAQGDLKTAAQHFQLAVELDPGNKRFEEDAFNARQLQRPDREVLQMGQQLVQHRDTALSGVRLLFEFAGRTAAADVYLSVAEGFRKLKLPNQQLNALEVALSEARESDLPDLESAAREFIRQNEPVGLIHSILGRTLQRMGRFKEAVTELEMARHIAPEVQLYTSQLANVYATIGNEALEAGDLPAAQHNFTTAHDLDLRNTDISLGLAAVHAGRAKQEIAGGLDTRARSDLRQAAALVKADKALDIEIANAYMRLGNRAQDAGENATALLDFQRAHERNPDLPGLRRQMADLNLSLAQAIIDEDDDGQLNTRQHEDIVAYHQAAFELMPLRASTRRDLANALNDFGLKLMNGNLDYQRAVDMFKRARDLFPDDASYEANWQQAWHLNEAQ